MRRKITAIPYTLLIKIFEADGFSIVRRKGDHIIMTKQEIKRPLVIKHETGLCCCGGGSQRVQKIRRFSFSTNLFFKRKALPKELFS